jgi:hypothetical protein
VIRIGDIKIDEDFFDILIRYLNKTTGMELEYYQKRCFEKRIKTRMIRFNSLVLVSFYKYFLKNFTADSLNRTYLKVS